MTEAEKAAQEIINKAKVKLQEFIKNLDELKPAYEAAKSEVENDLSLSSYTRALKLAKLRSDVNKAVAPSGETLKTISLLASICSTDDNTGAFTLVIKNGELLQE